LLVSGLSKYSFYGLSICEVSIGVTAMISLSKLVMEVIGDNLWIWVLPKLFYGEARGLDT